MDKILRINMGADGGPEIRTEPLGDYAGLGGRAMTSGIVAKEVPPLCHPLGEDNKLVIAPGLLSGSTALAMGSGMPSSPPARATSTMRCQSARFALASGQFPPCPATIPTNLGPPALASNIAYSPCQLSSDPSLQMSMGLRSSTGSGPRGPSQPASSVPPPQAVSPSTASTPDKRPHCL